MSHSETPQNPTSHESNTPETDTNGAPRSEREPSLEELLRDPEIVRVRPLLAELARLPQAQRLDVVRHDSRYHTAGTVAMLFAAAEATGHASPGAAAELARIAVELTGQLRIEREFRGNARELHALALAQLGRYSSYAGDHLNGYRRLHEALALNTRTQPLHPATRTLIHWALASYNSWQGYLPAARDHIEAAVNLAFQLPVTITGAPVGTHPDPFPLRHSTLFGRVLLDLRQGRPRRLNLLRDLEALRPSVSVLGDRAHAGAAWALFHHGQPELAEDVLDAGLRDDPSLPLPRLRWLDLLHGKAAGARRHDPASWHQLADAFEEEGSALEAVLVLVHGLRARLDPRADTLRQQASALAQRAAGLADRLTCAPKAATAARLLELSTDETAAEPSAKSHLDSLRLLTREILRAERAGGHPFPVYYLYWRL